MGFFVKRSVKKGAGMSTQQIIGLIITLIGFSIIVIVAIPFFTSSDVGDEEICRLSILARATAPTEAQGIVPINCRTKKICITVSGGGECEKNFAGEKNVVIEKIPKSYFDEKNWQKAKKFIEEKTVEAFYTCWSMTGKGKLDLFGNYWNQRGLEIKEPVCILCSKVAIDPSVLKTPIGRKIVDEIDVHGYMENTKIPRQTMTFLEAMTDRQVSSYSVATSNKFEEALNNPAILTQRELPWDSEQEIKESMEIAVIFSQVKATGYAEAYNELAKSALYLGATAFTVPSIPVIGPTVGKVTKRLILSPAGITAAILSAGVVVGYVGGTVYYGRELAAGYCGLFTTNEPNDKLKEGCSLVQIAPYKAGYVNAICPQIEGRP